MKKLIILITLISLPTASLSFAREPISPEQTILERINLARSNPWAEAARLGLNPDALRQATPPETAESWDQSILPLAGNYQLDQAAAEHCRYMIDRNHFSLVTHEGEIPEDRVAATGYQADLVKEEFSAMAFMFYINPGQASDEMLDSLLLKALRQKTADSVPALLDSEAMEAGISVQGGTVTLYGFTYNIYVLSIVVARPVDGDWRPLQCGHLYNDANGNNLFDQGEGISNEEIILLPLAGGLYPLKTGTDGAYCLRQPIDHHWLVKICKEIYSQYEDHIDDNPETSEIIDRDYNGWDFGCY